MKLCLLSSLLVGASRWQAARAADSPPNILFFLADDMGYGDAGYLSTGSNHGRILTPNLDKLVDTGMAFTEAYAGAPVCAPSRCTLMTGRHSGHCTVRSNGPILGSNDTCVATVLKQAGYATAHIGKWGLGDIGSSGDPIERGGFDLYFGQTDQAYCHNYYPAYMDVGPSEYWNVSDNKVELPQNANASQASCGADRLQCRWSGDEWTAQAQAYLHTRANNTQPFFLYLSYTAPHAGAIGSESEHGEPVPRISTGPYASKVSQWGLEVEYASAVTEIDTQFGLVMDTLHDAGLEENTIVFFASDNGASNEGGHSYQFFNSSGPLNGFKRSLHEGGHRSPLIVRWPGHVPAGVKQTVQQWAFYDFMATAADLAGLNVPDDLPPTARDGYSIKQALLGKDQANAAFIYHEYCQPNEEKNGWGQAVRKGNWSGVCVGPDLAHGFPACSKETFLLYDLSTDVGQKNNVASENADVVEELMKIMEMEHGYNQYCGAPSPPAPPVDPKLLTGDDWVQGNDKAPMGVAVANISTDPSTNTTIGDITLTCTLPCTCCKWRTASGKVVSSLSNGTQISIKAVGPESFSTEEEGIATSDSSGEITISWEQGDPAHWANWVKIKE